MKIYKTIEWDMGHRIPNHRSLCRNLHGHRYKLDVGLEGKLITKKGSSSEDMIIDFGDVKNILKKEVIDTCDHAFMVWQGDKPMMNFFKKNNSFKRVVVPFIPTAEAISVWLFKKLKREFKDKFKNVLTLESVTVWETPTSKACCSSKDI